VASAVSVSIGALTAAGTALWVWMTIRQVAWTAGMMDFILAAYLCRTFLTFHRNLFWGSLLAVVLFGSAFAAAILRQEILAAPVQFSDLFLLDDLFLYYGLGGAWYWQAALLAAGLFILVSALNLRRPTHIEMILLLPLLGLGLLCGMKVTAPALAARLVPPIVQGHSWFPEAAWFGQWNAFLRSALHYADREARIAALADEVKPDFGFIGSKLEAPAPRNVHIILLESFFDPREIEGVELSAEPFSPMFQTWRSRGGTHAVSPVYGDRSPDAEFELLCGLPATLDSSQVIYAQLAVDTVDCLPRKLAHLGWWSESWVPVTASLFNSQSAYRRIGIARSVYRDEMDMSDLDGEALSAQSLLRQNLAHVRSLLAGGKPFLNYLFTTAGHFPFSLDTSKRPKVIRVEPDSDLLAGFANNIHYTSAAVEAHVSALQALDPDGIIIVLGDHPPPLPINDARIRYPAPPQHQFEVPLIVIDGRKGPLSLPAHVPTYHLPFIVADLLTEGRFCQTQDCPTEHDVAIRPLLGGVLRLPAGAAPELCPDELQNEPCRAAQIAADAYRLAAYSLTERGPDPHMELPPSPPK
jgi:hypothetical protein